LGERPVNEIDDLTRYDAPHYSRLPLSAGP
jgi:hypothetical protein